MRTMYDAIGANVSTIPADAEIVAGYPEPGQLPGIQWTPADFARFPRAEKHRIATISEDWEDCSVADSELGDLAPVQCRGFVINRDIFRPATATVYREWAGLPQLLRACAGLSFNLWLAWWIGHEPVPAEITHVRSVLPGGVELVAWQWANRGTFDVSAVIDDDWHGSAT